MWNRNLIAIKHTYGKMSEDRVNISLVSTGAIRGCLVPSMSEPAELAFTCN